MLRPDDVTRYLHQQFTHHFANWARGKGVWPMRVFLRPPTTAERSTSPIACHEWANQWCDYTGPGTIEYANLRFPTGTHRMPKALALTRPGDVAAANSDDQQTWLRCARRLTQLQQTFPAARFGRIVRRITELAERDYQRLVNTVTWLHRNPTSGMLLRQLPIEGIDTKWLSSHATLLLAILGDADLPHGDNTVDDMPASRRRALHHRLGLRVPPELVQVTICDPDLRIHLAGMRHLAASVDDLNQWSRHPDAVIILENKETAYAITNDHPGTVVLHGQGFYVDQYARISWVRTARQVIYWGDIDPPGLQFVSDLRAFGISVQTILTDTVTLDRYQHLAVEGAIPQRSTTPSYLTKTERDLYERLVDHAAKHGTGLLLEQERIPWTFAYGELTDALDKGRGTSGSL